MILQHGDEFVPLGVRQCIDSDIVDTTAERFPDGSIEFPFFQELLERTLHDVLILFAGVRCPAERDDAAVARELVVAMTVVQ